MTESTGIHIVKSYLLSIRSGIYSPIPSRSHSDNWPPTRPLPQEYIIEFTDGCIPPNLHNSSDTPANFPTLDTIPREQRSEDYSDVYDGDQVEESSGLMINPAVMAAVASKAAMVSSPILPAFVHRRSVSTASTC